MKKVLFALLIALFGATSLFACEECRKKELAAKQGVLFPGWKVAPLQMGLGIDGWRGLADKDCDTVFSFVLFWMRQNSAVFSLAAISDLRNNYGIQLSPTITDAGDNYGLALGFVTTGRDGNHGLRIGIFDIEGKFEKIQFVGINCFDFLHLSLYNRGDHAVQIGLLANLARRHYDDRRGYFQLGVFNRGDAAFQFGLVNYDPDGGSAFQIGLLNYNPHSYILPVLPLVNFGAKPKKTEPRHGGTITVTVVGSDGKKETVYYSTPAAPASAATPDEKK